MSQPERLGPPPSSWSGGWKPMLLGAGLVLSAWFVWAHPDLLEWVFLLGYIVLGAVEVIDRGRKRRAAEQDDAQPAHESAKAGPSGWSVSRPPPDRTAVPAEVIAAWCERSSGEEGLFSDGFVPDDPFAPKIADRSRLGP